MTAPIAIETAAEAVALLERAIEGRESFVYPPSVTQGGRCVYVADGAPSCVVGQALALAGFGIDAISALDNTEACGTVGAGSIRFQSGFEDVSGQACSIFSIAQMEQDSGKTWGAALTAAREEATFFASHDVAGANV